jgi:hypothetical protein
MCQWNVMTTKNVMQLKCSHATIAMFNTKNLHTRVWCLWNLDQNVRSKLETSRHKVCSKSSSCKCKQNVTSGKIVVQLSYSENQHSILKVKTSILKSSAFETSRLEFVFKTLRPKTCAWSLNTIGCVQNLNAKMWCWKPQDHWMCA